jgi:uncharacterized protein YeaO (DUF488 family)
MSALFTPDLHGRVVTASCTAPAARAPNTARVLVTSHYPHQAAHGFFHAWWDHLAPAPALSTAYRTGAIAWAEFAYEYLAHLEADGRWWRWVACDVARLLLTHETVCLIGGRHAPDADESRTHCHRRLLWAWLVGADIAL